MAQTINQYILSRLQEHGPTPIASLRLHLNETGRRYNSLRTALAALAASGAIVRVSQGVYCLPGDEPNRYSFYDWAARLLKAEAPSRFRLQDLAERFRYAHGFRAPIDDVRQAMTEMCAAGLAVERLTRGVGLTYGWAHKPDPLGLYD